MYCERSPCAAAASQEAGAQLKPFSKLTKRAAASPPEASQVAAGGPNCAVAPVRAG